MAKEEKELKVKISSSWIFNRLCDEPERLRTEINKEAQALLERRHGDMVQIMEHFQQRYHERNMMIKLVAEMRLDPHPEIGVVNDTPYIKVLTTP